MQAFTRWIQRQPAALRFVIAGYFAVVGIGGTVLAITVPLELTQQLLFGGVVFAVGYALHRLDPTRITNVALAVLSTAISTRYIYWRLTQTLEFDNLLSLLLGSGLFLAEIYAWLILIIGYAQCIWPLHRKIRAIEGPPETWPTIDVFIPTYNESLSIVQDTILAAMSMDYPPDRFKVWILDDGRRPEFEQFAKDAGCGYLTRSDNKNAKAGNLNSAANVTNGELICIFDADHVATRAFLQLTVGWFQADPRLALLQTPHFFYSPDPVQRNIPVVREIQGEGSLFYGVVQEGNDFWNAAFFCGSCAIIRRAALKDTNGFTGETVTEDAHTSLKLQRKGWNTAYLNARLSAGLATERLALHIGQRARWARGMTQIFRIDNPLLGPGLSFMQRLCYLNAMLAFQFPLPRIVFLTSPLCYLLLGQNIINASPAMIMAYAAPHLAFAMLGNQRVQGKYGRALWSEVYEALIAFQLVGPSTLPLFNPKAGKFNVTDKGGLLQSAYFDWRSLRPQIITAGLLVLGIFVGFGRITVGKDPAVGTVVLNLFWSCYSLLTLMVVLVVGREQRQVRVHLRASARLPANVYFDDGHIASGTTNDVSMGGVSITLDDPDSGEGRTASFVELFAADRSYLLPGKSLRIRSGFLTMKFDELSIENRRGLVRVVFGRADAWPSVEDAPLVTVRKSVTDQILAAASLFKRTPGTAPKPRKNFSLKRKPKQEPTSLEAHEMSSQILKSAAGLALAVAVLALPVDHAWAQRKPAPAPAEPAPMSTVAAVSALPAGARRVSLSMKDLGVEYPLQLVSTLGEAGVSYDVRADEVVTQASLTFNFAYSPQLLSDISQMVVLLNNEVVASVPLVREGAGGVSLTIPIDPGLFTTRNRLNFRFIGHYTRQCEDPLHSTLWSNISNTRTKLNLTLQRLNTGADLARLPAPFFDRSDPTKLRLPFVFVENPSNTVLQAAAATASYFGMAASFRGFTFPVSFYDTPASEAIVFGRSGSRLGNFTLPDVNGPSLILIRNPRNPYALLLLVTGRTDAEVLAAAKVLAAAPSSLSGTRATVAPVRLPARKPYDGPRWLDTSKPARFGDLVALEQLEGQGLRPGLLRIPFRAPPDLFFWPRKGGKIEVIYRYPAVPWLDYRMSRFDALANAKYLRSFKLNDLGPADQVRETIGRPVSQNIGNLDLPAYNVFGQNQLQFYFDLRVAKKGQCQSYLPENVRVSIDADSTIDLSGASHFARLPDLAFFSSAGFPFSRMGDQSETAAVISSQPSAPELEAFLNLVGRFSDVSGVPATSIRIVRPGALTDLSGKDVLVVGTVGMAARMPNLFAGAPFKIDGGRLRVSATDFFPRILSRFGSNVGSSQSREADEVAVSQGNLSSLMSWRSPFDKDRVVIALLAASPSQLPAITASFNDPRVNYTIQGDLAIAGAGGYSSFRVGESFWVGDLPFVWRSMWWISENPIALAVVFILSGLILGGGGWLVLSARARRRTRELGEE
jgi:cellulose synthase (UDP-forming)